MEATVCHGPSASDDRRRWRHEPQRCLSPDPGRSSRPPRSAATPSPKRPPLAPALCAGCAASDFLTETGTRPPSSATIARSRQGSAPTRRPSSACLLLAGPDTSPDPNDRLNLKAQHAARRPARPLVQRQPRHPGRRGPWLRHLGIRPTASSRRRWRASREAVSAGVTLIDTAPMYRDCEAVIAAAFEGYALPSQVRITTKCFLGAVPRRRRWRPSSTRPLTCEPRGDAPGTRRRALSAQQHLVQTDYVRHPRTEPARPGICNALVALSPGHVAPALEALKRSGRIGVAWGITGVGVPGVSILVPASPTSRDRTSFKR